MVLSSFFASQLDYIFFVYGLSFVLMAAQCLVLRRRDQALPWGLLAAFGFIHGLNEWLDMLALSLPDTMIFKSVRLAVMAASFTVLIEFGRRGLRREGRPIIGGWLTPMLVGTASVGLLAPNLNGANAACRYALGLPGALMAAGALWQASRICPSGKPCALKPAAWSMLLYSLATGIVVPKSSFLPANLLNQDLFFQTLGLPIQLLGAACALAVMAGIWLYSIQVRPQAERIGGWRRWSYPVVCLLLVILGWFAANQRGKSVDAMVRADLLQQASEIAQTINPMLIDKLTFTPSDKNNPCFKQLREQIIAAWRVSQVLGIHSLARRQGVLIFGPESYPTGDPLASPPGTVFERPAPEEYAIFRTGKPCVLGPVTNEYGSFVTAYAPIIDPHSGRTSMAIGTAILAKDWRAQVAAARLVPILGTLLLALVLLGGMSAIQWRSGLPAHEQTRFRHIETIQVAVLGLAITVALSFLTLESENHERSALFNRITEINAERVRDQITRIQADTQAIGRLYESDERVDRGEFRALVAPMTMETPIQAFEWIPRVPAAMKKQFEGQATRDGYSRFSIWAKNAHGQKIAAAGRADYYPVYYVEPMEGNDAALGFDLGSETVRRAALEQAARTRLMTGTSPITLVQEKERQHGMLIFQPVYAGDKNGKNILRGFGLGVVRLQALLERTVALMDRADEPIELHLLDLMAPDGPKLIAVYPKENGHPEVVDKAYLKQFRFTSIRPVFAFGRAYAVVAHPTPDFYAKHPTQNSLAMGAAGLLLTIVMTILAAFLRNRQASLEQQVRERTEELRESEENLSITLRSIGDGVIATDTKERITRMNPVAEALTGWTVNAAMGQPFEEVFRIINTKTRKPAKNPISKALKSGHIVDMANHTVLIARDGAERQIADSAAPIRDSAGRVVGAVLVFHDVTQEYATLEALRESMDRLGRVSRQNSLLLETMDEGIFGLDAQGMHTFVNHAAAKMLGYSVEELVGSDSHSTWHYARPDGSAYPRDECPIRETVTKGTPWSGLTEFFTRKDGSGFFVEVNSSPLIEDGKITGAVVTFRDITERKQAEEKIEILARFPEENPDVVLRIGRDGLVLYANKPAGLLLQSLGSAVGSPAPATWRDWVTRAPANEARQTAEMEYDGRIYAFSLVPIEQGGYVNMYARNITEQKRAEEALRESEEKFRSLFEGSRDAVMTLEPPSWKFTSCNRATVEMFGTKDAKQFTSLGPWEVSPELQPDGRPSADKAKEMIETAMREGSHFFEWTHMGIGGEEFPATVLLSRMEQGGKAFLQATVRDITEQKRAEEVLQIEKDNLTAIFASSPVGMLLLDEQLMIVDANAIVASMVSKEPGEIIHQRGGGGLGCVHSSENEKGCGFSAACAECPLRKALLQILTSGTSVHGAEIQLTLVIGGQECRPWLRVSAEPVLLDGRKHVVVAIDDVTDRKQAEEALQEEERRYRSLWESANEGFCLHDLVTDASGQAVDYRILEVNPAYERITGLKADDVVGRLASQVYGTGDAPYLDIYARVASTGVSENFEAYLAQLDRHLSISVFCPSPGQFATAFSDISERKAHEEMLSHQATHDSLTGLPNRESFERHLRERTASAAGQKRKMFDLMFMDLDKFKLINDALGHKVGDLLLVAVADRLRSCLRPNDVLARMGGDEFTVILQSAGRRSLTESVAARIIDSISRPFEIEGHKLVIGVSFGLAACPSDGTDSVTLLKHADAAMYKAKEAGRGTFRWFTGEVEAENRLRADMERDLRHALEDNHLKVHYQPVVRLDDGSLHGAEALMRWEHDEKGMISPSLFIPIAEEIGLIGLIGDYVLRTACSQTMAWRDEGMQLSQIGVNVSTVQIRDTSWLDSVKAAISNSGLDPRHLVLELTESDFAADYQSLRASLHEVQQLGIGISIDDFGMGQSSLSRLKDFDVIELKIDGSFVRDIEHDENDRALLKSIIEMAHDQGIKVTAEWVETEAQRDILRASGCDFAQGYFFSPPLPADEFRAFALEQMPSAKRKRRAA